eukprot:CAMPEP_0194538976 /NCGR_PEP_ID=MMETSP0253-20130528/78759_1 /TAXON_ID=2966 /ORGANISM="Noctiluca scintillans" /LENGTH=164 /DNA_ID=CAMNT_0039385181 /DNA_START=28 /DNA_END=519 /DNA_ORIENTATION=-
MANTSGPRTVLAPVVAPLTLQTSVISFKPVVDTVRSRTEVELVFSPVVLTLGAWQLRFLVDVFSFREPCRKEDTQAAAEPLATDAPFAADLKAATEDSPRVASAATRPGALCFAVEISSGGRSHRLMSTPSADAETWGSWVRAEEPDTSIVKLPILCGVMPEDL